MALGVTPKEIIESQKYPLLEKHKSWNRIKLDEIATVQNGYAFDSEKFNKKNGTPLIRIRDVGKNNTEDYYKGEYDEEYLVHPGDILIGMDGDFRCAIWSGPEALLNQRVCRVQIKSDSFSKEFLYYLLQPYLDAIHAETSSVTVKHLSSKTIKDIPLPNPSLPTQHRIVEKIEELFSDLDNGIENLKTAKHQLKIYKQSVLKAAFEGKLTKQWREQQEDLPTPEELKKQIEEERKRYREQQLEEWRQEVKEWEEAGEPRKKPRKPSKPKDFNDPSREELNQRENLPETWYWEKLGFVSRSKGGHAFKSKNYEDNGQYQIIRMGNVRPGRLRLNENPVYLDEIDEKTKEKALLKKGDIIITLTGTRKKRDYGYSVMINKENLLLNQRIARLRFNKIIKPKYFLYYSWTRSYQDQFFTYETGNVGQGNVSMSALSDTLIPIVSISEQDEIVDEIESKLSVISTLRLSINKELDKAKVLRQSILKKAFEGKLIKKLKEKHQYQKPLQKYYKNTATDLHAGIMAKIIDAHYLNEKHLNKLNHVKCEKIVHMVESHLGIDLQREPVKDAAGPDDYTRLKKVEHRANRKNWFVKDSSLGGKFGYGYKPKKSISYGISEIEKIKDLPLQDIYEMINLFLPMDKQRAEVVATLYAAWNNFLIDGHQPTDDEIIKAAREEWSKQKLKIKRPNFVKALNWMRQKSLIPSGLGKPVKGKT